MKEDLAPTSLSKPKMKVRLARKYALKESFLSRLDPPASGNPNQTAMVQVLGMSNALVEAYVAGFEKAKALIIDHVQRSIDERIQDTDYKEASGGRAPSEVLAMIGEDQ